MSKPDRYHRQALLPQVGSAGQKKLADARVVVVGCGALGCATAQQLARCGIGQIRLVDRDLVDLTNLHRQVLFAEADAREQMPKAIAAANALARVNSQTVIEPLVADLHSGNIAEVMGPDRPTVILDGTDNAQTRYLINDFAVREHIPWVYGACVGVEGRVMAIVPGQTACLRCLFPQPPAPGELATCDTAGVLPPAAAVVGAMQAAQAMRLIIEGPQSAGQLLALDAWTMRFRSISTGERRADCPCCGRGDYDFLNRQASLDAATLCGRDAVQIRCGRTGSAVDLPALADRLRSSGEVRANDAFARFIPGEHRSLTLSVFPDGRVIVNGTNDIALARTIVARYIGQ